ncbi:hypothetical protein DIPPA_59765 [Diplonema papillatum]|nr:hypothetical protein DIPPA_59765 [Diplonema papillatum]
MSSTLLFVFGCNNNGQLGAAKALVARPRLVHEFRDRQVTNVWCGASRTLVVADGYLYESQGPLGFPRMTAFDSILSQERVVRAVDCVLFTLVVTSNHRILVHNSSTRAVSELRLTARSSGKEKISCRVRDICAGALYAGILTESGTVHTLGMNHTLQLGVEEAGAPSAIDLTTREVVLRAKGNTTTEHVLQLRCGATHAAALTSSGHLFLWGANSVGELGFCSDRSESYPASLPVCLTDGSLPQATVSFPTFAPGSVADVACGDRTTYFILPSGAMLYCGALCTGSLYQSAADTLRHSPPAHDRSALGPTKCDGSRRSVPERARLSETIATHTKAADQVAAEDDLQAVLAEPKGKGTCVRIGHCSAIRMVSAGGGWQNTHCLLADVSHQIYVHGSNSKGQLGMSVAEREVLSSNEIMVQGKTSHAEPASADLERLTHLVTGKYELERHTENLLAPLGVLRCWVKRTDVCTIVLSVASTSTTATSRGWKLTIDDASNNIEGKRWEFGAFDSDDVQTVPGEFRGWRHQTCDGEVLTMDVRFYYDREAAEKTGANEWTKLPLPFVGSTSKVVKTSVFAGWLHSAVLVVIDKPQACLYKAGSFGALVDEAMRLIFSFLTPSDRTVASLTCWRMCIISRHNIFWEHEHRQQSSNVPDSLLLSNDPVHFFTLVLNARKEAGAIKHSSFQSRGAFSEWLGRLLGTEAKPMRVLLFGLDAAGKTTILYRLKLGESLHTIPTLGFNVETVRVGRRSICMWDLGGGDALKALWHHYYANTNAMIFVVDSTDRVRLSEASRELHLRYASLSQVTGPVPILIFANKQDDSSALTTGEVSEGLCTASLQTPSLRVQPAVAKTGKGLYEGLVWLDEVCQ